MNCTIVRCAATLGFFVALPALAQEKANIFRVLAFQPTAGGAAKFEDGRKKHMDFHRKQKDI